MLWVGSEIFWPRTVSPPSCRFWACIWCDCVMCLNSSSFLF
jgi:hypothetical protein